MSKSQHRLFVGNLPSNIREQELQNEFSAYGSVRKAEVKHKKRPDSEEILSTFAFITIDIDPRMLTQCLQEFKDEQFRGRYLQVSVARENFLDKLKREREEAAQNGSTINFRLPSGTTNLTESIANKPTTLPILMEKKEDSASNSSGSEELSSEDEDVPAKIAVTKPVKPTNGVKKADSSSSSSSSSSESESSDDEENLIMRKKSKMFMENGKIKIDHTVSGGEAIHIIQRNSKKSAKKEFDAKSMKADQKRIDSLNKMKDSYTKQKLAIKTALATVDSAKKNNKIVFSDAEDEVKSTENLQKSVKTPKAKEKEILTLFEDDVDEDGNEDYSQDFAIKKQFQGAKGEKLMRLQSRFQNDRRFNMDERFLDEGGADEDVEDHREEFYGRNGLMNENIYSEEIDERQWQYNILESVMGKKISQGPPAPSRDSKKKGPQTMLRFDPTREDHLKFVEAKKRKAPKQKDDKNAKRFKDETQNLNSYENTPEVSKDKFFNVSERLKSSIGQSTGFSVLQMFGRGEAKDQSSAVLSKKSRYQEIPIAQNVVKGLADLNPFSYDSSDGEDDTKKEVKHMKSVSLVSKTGKIWHEPFFMLDPSDARFLEGLSLFSAAERTAEDDDERATKKQELRNIVKKKIKKSIRNALPRHAKPNKRFKRLTKDF